VGITQLNNNILVVLDNNPDTWFEYERVVQVDDGEPLTLDFTVNIGETDIINYIRVNPNNFGTKTEIEIVDISTSADGEIYLSIKDDIPIAGFTVEDEDNVFKLAPATSKYAGQGIYTFTPRYAKYIRLVLRQSTPYPITTVQGTQLRYAVGLRDIEVQRQAYEAAGEIVSVPFTTPQEIKKVTLETNQTPVEQSELANIVHQISVDEGNSWHTVAPLTDDPEINIASEAREILNINTEDSDSLTTENPVTSIRYKAVLSRDSEGFTDGSSSFAEAIIPFTELKPVPQGDPPALELTHRPVVGSLTILDPSFGSRGNSSFKYIIGQGKDAPFRLPWDRVPSDMSKDGVDVVEREIASIYVDGVLWERRPSFANSGPEDNHYVLTRAPQNGAIELEAQSQSSPHNTAFQTLRNLVKESKKAKQNTIDENLPVELRFGNGNNGRQPADNATIEILFTPERLYPIGKDEHVAELEFPTSVSKADVVVTRFGGIEAGTADLSSNSNIHRLPDRYLADPDSFRFTTPLGGTTISGFMTRRDFQNGLAAPEGELENEGDWSVDLERGIIYTYDRIDTAAGTVTYKYQAQENLSSAQWDWGDDSSTPGSIKILPEGWITETGNRQVVTASGVNSISLPHLALVQGSIEFTLPAGIAEEDNPFLEEVPLSGLPSRPELSTVIKTEEKIPTTNPVGNIATFTVSTFITEDEKLGVAFDDTDVFQNDVTPAAPAATGEYHVNRSLNTIAVWTGGADLTDVGKVYYYADDPSRVAQGAYTVDYREGKIYMQRGLPTDESYGIKYEYTDYRARYNITRQIPEKNGATTNWQLDPVTKTVTLFAPEILNRLSVSSLSSNQSFKPLVYQINYKYIDTVRQNIADLEPYFSPVLKDYALKIVTKDNI
jgi:hypothetical protein